MAPMPPLYEAYVGPLLDAPEPFLARVRPLPIFQRLHDTPWANACFVPAHDATYDADIALLIHPYSVDGRHGWMLTTLGLSALRQTPLAPGHVAPAHVELAFHWADPTDRLAAFRSRWAAGTFDVVHPVFEPFLNLAHEVASLIVRRGEAFAWGDTIGHTGIYSTTPGSLLVPPTFELAFFGLRPFDARTGQPAQEVDLHTLDRQRLLSAGDVAFLQVAPLLPDELAIASANQGFAFFMDGLLPTDDEFDAGLSSGDIIADVERESRVPQFEAARVSGA